MLRGELLHRGAIAPLGFKFLGGGCFCKMLCLLGIWWSFGAKKELELGGRGGMEVSGKYFVNSCFADLGFWFCLLFSVCRFQNSAQQLWACKGCLCLWSHG